MSVSSAADHWAVWWDRRGSGGADGVLRPEDSQPVHDSLSKPAALSLSFLSLVAPKAQHNKCVCVTAGGNRKCGLCCLYECIYFYDCVYMSLYVCEWLSRGSCWHPFQDRFTTAAQHKSLLSVAPLLSFSLCHYHSTCCHHTQLLVNLYTWRKGIWSFGAYSISWFSSSSVSGMRDWDSKGS